MLAHITSHFRTDVASSFTPGLEPFFLITGNPDIEGSPLENGPGENTLVMFQWNLNSLHDGVENGMVLGG